MLTKNKVLKTVKELPEKFSIDELIDKIILLHKIEIGEAQSKSGKVLSTPQAKKRLSIVGSYRLI